MRKRQKIISMALCLCMVLSIAAVGSFSGSAAEVPAESVSAPVFADHPELAQDTIQGGAILHCFCWSFDQIRQNLAYIKEAGYTAIQTSPVQPPKDYNSAYTNTSGQWWKLYQPLDLCVAASNSWLGTKDQLTQLCTEAETYGIKVIVDIVANHVANNQDDSGTFEHIHADVAQRLRNAEYYHDIATKKPDGSTNRHELTHYHIGMPDLNTENADVQRFVIGLCEECINCGVDGFRFDTAKAIEVPNDPVGTQSNFWPNVTNAIKAKNPDAFIYGEILGSTCTSALTDYTDYMKLTDDTVGYNALNAVKNGSSRLLAGANEHYTAKANDGKKMNAEDSIVWAESHDTYMNGGGSSQGATDAQIVKTWAIVGARNQSTSLFFARPNATMGLASSDITWKSTPVAEVNKFKNLFDGKSEHISYDRTSAVTLLERGKKGAVVSKITEGSSVSIPVHQMVDGAYIDHVSGNTFTVSNGVLTGTIDSSGVAVIYNANDIEDPVITASKLYLSATPGWTLSDNRNYAMYLFNDSDSQWVGMTAVDGQNGVFEGVVPTGQWTGVIFVRKDSSLAMGWNNNSVKNQTVDLFPSGSKDFFTVAPAGSGENNEGTWSVFGETVDDTPDMVTNNILYLDVSGIKNSKNEYWWGNDGALTYAYYFNNDTNPKTNTWVEMVAVENESYKYKVTIPEGTWPNVIFTRMNPENIDAVENKWDNRWNQTADLEVPPSSSDSRCYKLTNSKTDGKENGEWIQYHNTHTYTPSWSWSNDKSTATLTLTCDCGRVLTFEKNVTPDSDEDKDVYTASVRYQGQVYEDSQTVYKQPTFEGHSITVDGKIGIYFYVDLHQFTTSPTVSFVKGGTVSGGTLIQTKSGSSLYKAAYYVAPKEMGDSVTATVTADGKTITETSSVKDYLIRLYKNENNEAGSEKPDELRALARSLLNYGAKAQLQFGYKTGEYDLVDYGLDVYTPATPSGISKITDYNLPSDSHLAYASSSLILNNDTTLRIFFSKTEGFTTAPTLICDEKTLAQGTKGGYITYDITGIAAPNVLNTHMLTFPDSTTAGFTACNYILNNYSKSSSLGAVVTALYDYSVKASAYLNS